jgi:hypothetical protein
MVQYYMTILRYVSVQALHIILHYIAGTSLE